jgi:radical SAM protein (TIGR01212 family)
MPDKIEKKPPYYDLNSYFKGLFGQRVHKISLDAGFNCPNRDGTIAYGGCIYCNERGSGTGAHQRGISITQQLESTKAAVTKRFKAKKYVAYFQAYSNTYAPVERLRAVFDEALKVADMVGLFIGTRPDCIDEEKLALLEEYAKHHLVWLEYGLQSVHDATLFRINRGHDFATFQKAVEQTQGRNINICAHVILGLPGEDRRQMMETADTIARMGIHGIKLHLLYVVKGTKLTELYAKGQYRCLDQKEYVQLVVEFLERLPADMVIQRLTGDPHRHELVAPHWSLRKDETVKMIRDRLEKQATWQGRRFTGQT